MQKTRRAYKSCRYVSCVTWRVCSLPLHCTLDTKYMLCSILSMNVITTMMPIDFASHSSPLVNLSDFFLISIRPKVEIFWPARHLQVLATGALFEATNCGVLSFWGELWGPDVWCTDQLNVAAAATVVIWPLSCLAMGEMMGPEDWCNFSKD